MNSTDKFLMTVKRFGLPTSVRTEVEYDEVFTYGFNEAGKEVLRRTESGTAVVYCESDEFEDADGCMTLIQAIVSDNVRQDTAVTLDSTGRTRHFHFQLHESFPYSSDHEFLVDDTELSIEIKKAGINHDVDFILDNVDGSFDYYEKSFEKNFSNAGWADAVFSDGSVIRFKSEHGVIVAFEVEVEDEDEDEDEDEEEDA